MALTWREIPVKHDKYMLKNRGVPPEDMEFYNNAHAVEDLIKIIEGQANP
jgi:hypothetical protein